MNAGVVGDLPCESPRSFVYRPSRVCPSEATAAVVQSGMSSSHPNPQPRVNLLRRLACGNTVECKPADLLRFTRTKWLTCCGDVMTLFTAGDQPTARDTQADERRGWDGGADAVARHLNGIPWRPLSFTAPP